MTEIAVAATAPANVSSFNTRTGASAGTALVLVLLLCNRRLRDRFLNLDLMPTSHHQRHEVLVRIVHHNFFHVARGRLHEDLDLHCCLYGF